LAVSNERKSEESLLLVSTLCFEAKPWGVEIISLFEYLQVFKGREVFLLIIDQGRYF
jgi:hypothetical protein